MGVYEELGLRPIINASGAVTRLGGAPMPSQVLAAFCEAASQSVPLDELQAAASRQIARVTGAEAGLVTAGAAASLTLGTAAILTGLDLKRMECLPDCQGFPHQFVMAREQRNGYDHAVRAAGARLVEVGFHEIVANAGVRRAEVWEYEAVFGPHTAGVLYVESPHSKPDLAAVVACAHRHGIPVLVDAAGELPPRSNLRRLVASGADLVAFSGGKAIRGPQSTGILCGRHDLIAAAALQMLDMDDHWELWDPPSDFIDKSRLPGMPRHGIGRGFKVSKEEVVALIAALMRFESGEYDHDMPAFRETLQAIKSRLDGCAARCTVVDAAQQGVESERIPILEIAIDERALGHRALEICRRLRLGDPRCFVGHGRLDEGILVVNPLNLRVSQAVELADRLREELTPR